MKLKVLYIGDFTGKGDEGLTQLSQRFFSHFNNKYEVKYFNTFEIKKFSSIKTILKFKPNIIHYLTGPTIRSFIISWILKGLLYSKPKTILSATRPFLNTIDRKLIKYFKPDLIFTQASKWDVLFSQNGIPTTFIPNPVDLKKFKKLEISKVKLREKYGLPVNKKLLLHVGHIKENRKLNFLSQIQNRLKHKHYQVVMVRSTFFTKDNELTSFLLKNNCIIINDFLEKIEEIYNACDYYIFPLGDMSKNHYPKSYNEIGVIDMPLSILEAMACDLPVISTQIDAIEILLQDIKNPPIAFFRINEESFINALNYLDTHNQFDFLSVIKKIDSNAVFEEIDKLYRMMGDIL